MPRSSKGLGDRRAVQRQSTDTGTIKSIERQQGTGSIAPGRDAQVQADTGFTRLEVADGGFDTLEVGDTVQFNADLAPGRPGYADAVSVHADLENDGRLANEAATSPQPEESRGRPPGAAVSASAQVAKNSAGTHASGEEMPG